MEKTLGLIAAGLFCLDIWVGVIRLTVTLLP